MTASRNLQLLEFDSITQLELLCCSVLSLRIMNLLRYYNTVVSFITDFTEESLCGLVR